MIIYTYITVLFPNAMMMCIYIYMYCLLPYTYLNYLNTTNSNNSVIIN